MNKAILVGNLGRDPELKEVGSKLKVCNFTLATTESVNGVKKTEWHNIVAWNRAAEVLAQYLQKGSKVYIEGRIQRQDWTPDDGIKRSRTDIVVERFEFLSRSEGQGQTSSQPEKFGEQQWSKDDDIPF